MQTTYAQKNDTVQKASANTGESVVDSSSQSATLQWHASLAKGVAQRAPEPRPNLTGMPDNLKAGIESLSGFSMDDVRVHYNSNKPATVQALAYTQGTDIHVAPGQEKCLPHEAWHVAQQMAGRVSPTTNINGMPVNDNAALEHEADVMGEKALKENKIVQLNKCEIKKNCAAQLKLDKYRLNVVGENHSISNGQRGPEENFVKSKIENGFYKLEYEFLDINNEPADPPCWRLVSNVLLLGDFTKGFLTYCNLFKSYAEHGIMHENDAVLRFFERVNCSVDYACKHWSQMCLLEDQLGIENSELGKDKKNISAKFDELKKLKNKMYSFLLERQGAPFKSMSIELYSANFGRIAELLNDTRSKIGPFVKWYECNYDLKSISFYRSRCMHLAANSNYDRIGVWKIGEEHYADIYEKLGKVRNYNLIDKDTFYSEMNEAGYHSDCLENEKIGSIRINEE